MNRRSFLFSATATAGSLLIPERRLSADILLHANGDSVCVDTEFRLSFKGYKHCELHPYYQVVFPKWGCHCGSGECRPSTFKVVPTTTDAPEGILVMVGGIMFPVPKGRLKRDRDIPAPLLEWDAHVCCTVEPPTPTITCAWINHVIA